MVILLEIIFWGSLAALAHTYFFFPMLIRWLAAGKSGNPIFFEKNAPELPRVSVVMSVFNEEKVILEKLESLAATDFPAEKIQFFVGSDCSDDSTNLICERFAAARPNFFFKNFEQRRGKPSVINDLAKLIFEKNPPAKNHLLLLTDASVMLERDTIFQLSRHFKNEKIGVVDAQIRAAGLRAEGISRSENQYLTGETLLKHHESLAWGAMMGPFGGCYALRSDLFESVPTNHLVDDFWLNFRVLEHGFQSINELAAVCHEGATHRTQDEYRRKKRIAAGSFQNLWAFRRWVLPPSTRIGFAFFSHKVLRWFGGFFLGAMLISAGGLAFFSGFFLKIFGLLLAVLAGVPLLDFLFKSLKINFLPLRNLSYFLAMNLALVEGFFKFRRGIRSGTWTRTPR